MPQPGCARCRREMEKTRSGVSVLEDAKSLPAGYKLWSADLYRCPTCGFLLIAGYGSRPVFEHHQIGFADAVEAARLKGDLFLLEEA